MFELYIENDRNERLDLSPGIKEYSVLDVKGLNPPSATINLSDVSGLDGARFNSSKIESRDITITIKINQDIEENRIRLYDFFRVKQYSKIHYKSRKRDVVIEGYVESFDCDFFVEDEQAQIAILCPEAYWKDAYEFIADISQIIPKFEFPFSIPEEGIEFSIYNEHLVAEVVNVGDVETGVLIQIDVIGSVKHLKIYNADTRDVFGFDYPLQYGDYVEIDSRTGSKGIYLLRNGKRVNLINYLDKGITWLTLKQGTNTFTYTCEDGTEYLLIRIATINKYSGV